MARLNNQRAYIYIYYIYLSKPVRSAQKPGWCLVKGDCTNQSIRVLKPINDVYIYIYLISWYIYHILP